MHGKSSQAQTPVCFISFSANYDGGSANIVAALCGCASAAVAFVLVLSADVQYLSGLCQSGSQVSLVKARLAAGYPEESLLLLGLQSS